MLYLDSNVFIYPELYKDEKAKNAKKILIGLANKKFNAFTSFITLDECCWIVWRNIDKDTGIKFANKLFKFPNLRFVSLNDEIIRKMFFNLESYDIQPRDAIHLASMQNKNIKTIITDDNDFNQIDDIERLDFIQARKKLF